MFDELPGTKKIPAKLRWQIDGDKAVFTVMYEEDKFFSFTLSGNDMFNLLSQWTDSVMTEDNNNGE